jgi:hypothetical protein
MPAGVITFSPSWAFTEKTYTQIVSKVEDFLHPLYRKVVCGTALVPKTIFPERESCDLTAAIHTPLFSQSLHDLGLAGCSGFPSEMAQAMRLMPYNGQAEVVPPVAERCECHSCIAEQDLRGPGGLPLLFHIRSYLFLTAYRWCDIK